MATSSAINNEPVASGAKVDMKFEVIVIPVADVDRSKAWALFESQADLLRRQVDNRARDCADIAGDWLITVWRQLNPNCPFHGGGPGNGFCIRVHR